MGYSSIASAAGGDDGSNNELVGNITTKQPARKETLRYQALQAAVAEG